LTRKCKKVKKFTCTLPRHIVAMTPAKNEPEEREDSRNGNQMEGKTRGTGTTAQGNTERPIKLSSQDSQAQGCTRALDKNSHS
jgi:hypothetical protein